MIKRKFKRVGEDQAIELSRKIDKMDACIEELLCIKAQVNVAIEKLEEIRKLEGPIAPEYLMEIIEVLQGDGI